jgi:3-oxoacyl-[acyl-carrier-protein] synthase-1
MSERGFLLAELGVVSALGCGADETLSRMAKGDVSGMKSLTGLSGGDSTVFGFAPDTVVSSSAIGKSGTRIGAILDATMEQLSPAMDELRRKIPANRIGAVIGTSNSTMEEFTDNPDKIDMAYPAERLKDRWGVGGPAWSVSTACSSSAKVFASARHLISSGVCDAVLVGGADAYTRTVVEGFHSLEALSSSLTRPLAADRCGINLGEGAAIFIMRRLEDDEDGVVLAGVGESSDAHHLTSPDPEGKGAEMSMRAALADAGLEPSHIDYINLHGTGTTYNDSMECAAVRRVFGDAVRCSSTKPLTGHCLGAAGAVEAALCWLALRNGRGLPPHVVPTVDSSLAPFHVPKVGDATPLRSALSNSFAFGGSNATIILSRIARQRKDLV